MVIQQNQNELWATQIAPTDYAAKTPTGVESLTVKQGDMIYFRGRSIVDGAYDQVQWNPVIQYTNVTATLDANQLDTLCATPLLVCEKMGCSCSNSMVK